MMFVHISFTERILVKAAVCQAHLMAICILNADVLHSWKYKILDKIFLFNHLTNYSRTCPKRPPFRELKEISIDRLCTETGVFSARLTVGPSLCPKASCLMDRLYLKRPNIRVKGGHWRQVLLYTSSLISNNCLSLVHKTCDFSAWQDVIW